VSARFKICGLTRLEDAQLAVDAGAWALGVILWEGSPRRCDAPTAELIARTLKRRAQVCGVFHNAALDEVIESVETLGLTMAQLHGDEGPSFCDEVRRRTGAQVIKAARVASAADVRDLDRFHHVDFQMLDTHRAHAPGGTGETFDWSLAAARRSSLPLILSGGLDAGNVGAAIAAVSPFAVDSASGTESAPGIKDPAKVAAFAEAVRAAGTPLAATSAGEPAQ
jgi:phosphoribosylanthranilate isomerase